MIVLPEFDGDLNDRALYEIIPFLKHLASRPGDVREEIRTYGSENTADSFNALRAQRRNIILRQQERGLSGVMSNISKAQGLQARATPAAAVSLLREPARTDTHCRAN